MSKVDPNTPILRKDLDEVVGVILEGMNNMFADPDNPMNKKLDKVASRLDIVEKKIVNVEAHLTDEIKGLKAEFSQQVSKKEFNQLKTKVDDYISAN